jgi:hypothetical protein
MECKRNITIYVETVKESFGLIGIQLAKIYKENFDVSSEDPLKTASRLIWLRNETIKRLFLEARDGIVVSAYPMDFALQSCRKLGGGGNKGASCSRCLGVLPGYRVGRGGQSPGKC